MRRRRKSWIRTWRTTKLLHPWPTTTTMKTTMMRNHKLPPSHDEEGELGDRERAYNTQTLLNLEMMAASRGHRAEGEAGRQVGEVGEVVEVVEGEEDERTHARR